MKILFFAVVIAAVSITSPVHAKHVKKEAQYQQKWCASRNGQSEVVLPDRSRCDCITDSHAIEIEFAEKWPQAIGQSLFYSLQTGKRPGIGLIMESDADRKYWIRLNSTIQHFKLPIDVWEVSK